MKCFVGQFESAVGGNQLCIYVSIKVSENLSALLSVDKLDKLDLFHRNQSGYRIVN